MTPKIFPTEVKKPVSRLCRPGGKGGGGTKKRKKEEKKKKEASVHFPDSIPLCHSSSFFLSLFLSVLRHRSLLSSLSSTPLPPPAFPPSIAHFSTIFPARSISIVLERRHCRRPSFLRPFSQRRVFSKLGSSPHTRIVLETENEPCYDGIFERLVNSIHGN